MKKFTKEQSEAIDFYKGPAMVLAGPGSGKTTVITNRIYNLIFKYKVAPENILVVTFTKAAADNMSLRFKALVTGRMYPVFFGTFHSVFFKILRLEKNYKPDSIIDDRRRFNIIKEIVIRLKLSVPSLAEFVLNVSDEISKVKGNGIKVEEYESVCCKKEVFKKVLNEYEKSKKYENKIDFEDLLLECYALLKSSDAVRKKWQEIFKFILIDEFQDINRIQYEIIKMLLGPENNLFIVGDDDQSIYGFRGAKPEIMREFTQDYSNTKTIMLGRNFRSTPEIVNMSDRVIRANVNRLEKDIYSQGDNGPKPSVKMFKNVNTELNYICKKAKEYISKGIKPDEIVILVRNNVYIKDILKSLGDHGLRAETKNKINTLYMGEVAVDIKRFFGAAINWEQKRLYNNDEAIAVINVLNLNISKRMIIEEQLELKDLFRVYGHEANIRKSIEKFSFHVKMLRKLNPYGAINYIKNAMGYENYLRDKCGNNSKALAKVLGDLNSLYIESSSFKTLEDWIDYCEKQSVEKKAVELNSNGGNQAATLSLDGHKSKVDKLLEKEKEIKVMTMHGAKGLEFKVVFVVHANQGIIPGSRACRARDYEEERRVFYVAMTRAIKYLHISYVEEVLGYRMQPSMFIGDALGEQLQKIPM